MWPIEEYAISAFMSVCRIQIAPVIQAPKMHRVESGLNKERLRCGNNSLRRMRP